MFKVNQGDIVVQVGAWYAGEIGHPLKLQKERSMYSTNIRRWMARGNSLNGLVGIGSRSRESSRCLSSLFRFLSVATVFLSQGLSSCQTQAGPATLTNTEPQDSLAGPWVERGEIYLEVESGWSPIDIVHSGFESWMGQYLQENAPSNVALLDYEIDSIEAVSDPFFAGNYDFVFLVEYSVRPRSQSSRWMAGDGRQGTGGWIVDKSHYVGVLISGANARVLILGSCPMC